MKRKALAVSFVAFILVSGLSLDSRERGKFEFNVHYSYWTLDVIKPLIEESMEDVCEDNLKDEILEELRADYPDIQERSYSQEISFDSNGSNYGCEARWYPAGRDGSFSLGLAVEKTSMKVSFPQMTAHMELQSAGVGDAVFDAQVSDTRFDLKPLSFHLSFRWDIVPTGRIHPFITFGVGIFPLKDLEKGRLHSSYDGQLKRAGYPDQLYHDEVDKTVKQAIEESEDEVDLPAVLPIVQLDIGLKWLVSDAVGVLLEAGVWDGFILRGGISFRF